MKTPKIGVALSGGGARGLAHIGVLKVLEQEHIPIACLSGASIGGLIAGVYAAGMSIEELETEALHMAQVRELMRLFDLKPQPRGLIEGRRLHTYLEEKLGGSPTFAQTRLPVALVATDFPRSETVVLRSGSLVEAIQATCAFPGLFSPVVIEGKTLVDGGLLNNLPVEALPALGAEVIIAVDVIPPIPRALLPGESAPRQLPRFLPGVAEELYQATQTMIAALTAARLAMNPPDLVLRPAMPDDLLVFLGFPRAAEAIAAGEKSARAALPQIRDILREKSRSGLAKFFSNWSRKAVM